MKPKIHLITRADDAGNCRSANEAILEGVEAGIIKNVSFMAVGPEIEHAVELLGGRDDICYGFHVCLNAEWEHVKWKPLTNTKVLVDENGYFLPFPNDTKAQVERLISEEIEQEDHVPEPDDIRGEYEREIRTQYEKLRDLGLPISYVDEHMRVSWIDPHLRHRIAELCNQHALIDAHSFSFLPEIESTKDVFSDLEARIKRAMLDKYVWVTHPGKIAPDMEIFALKGNELGEVARERDAERQLLIGSRLPELLAKWNVKTARYDEV
ncbi:MAG TPA: ChbG/HpnK family deacetylase [Abditibacterium sp.]